MRIWALAANGTAAFAAACNGLTGANQNYEESPCFPLPSAECDAGADSGSDVMVIVVGSDSGLDGGAGANDATAAADGNGSSDVTTADSQPGADAIAQADSWPMDDGAGGSDGAGDAAACDGGTTLCGSACVDLSSDPHNCGRCGFDCGSATCSSGMCLLTSTGGLGPLVVNGGYVYWAHGYTGNNQSDTLYRVPTEGGAIITYPTTFGIVSQISPFGLYVVTLGAEVAQIWGTNLNVINNTFNNNTLNALGGIAEASQTYWFLDLRDTTRLMTPSSVYRDTSATPAYEYDSTLNPTRLLQTTPMASLGPSTPNIWWVRPGQGIDTLGSGLTMTGLADISNLAVDSSYLWAIAGSGIYRCGGATCPAATLWASNQSAPAYISSDGTSVYWTNSGNGEVMKCAVASADCNGSGVSPTPIAQHLSNPFGLAVDSIAVYVETATGVYKIAK